MECTRLTRSSAAPSGRSSSPTTPPSMAGRVEVCTGATADSSDFAWDGAIRPKATQSAASRRLQASTACSASTTWKPQSHARSAGMSQPTTLRVHRCEIPSQRPAIASPIGEKRPGVSQLANGAVNFQVGTGGKHPFLNSEAEIPSSFDILSGCPEHLPEPTVVAFRPQLAHNTKDDFLPMTERRLHGAERRGVLKPRSLEIRP